MTDDIVARLRDIRCPGCFAQDEQIIKCECELAERAADEIERLRAENDELRFEFMHGYESAKDEYRELVNTQEAEIARKDAALDILQAAMVAKKPIPMPFKIAINQARAALAPAQEATDV
jgi:hypothetical protein